MSLHIPIFFIFATATLIPTILSNLLLHPSQTRQLSPCSSPLPSDLPLPTNPKLPDPFRFLDANPNSHTDNRATTKQSFLECRQEQVRALFQRYELGELPPRPEVMTASFTSNQGEEGEGEDRGERSGTLTIHCVEKGREISFSVNISYPSSTKGTTNLINPGGAYPAVIAFGSLSIPLPTTTTTADSNNDKIAIITFNNTDLAAQTDPKSRGIGKFYDLYSANHSAGAMIAWAWGVSRILDALESPTIAPLTKIRVDRIGVTGCSRNGKGVLVAGAFDERIALTIPQESGSGGAACWRLSDAMWDSGQNVQTAREIVTENVWFSTRFDAYAETDVDVLPFDHHMLAGLVAPRGLFVVENTGIEWLGNMSCYGCMKTARKVWTALGVEDRMGFSQVGNHEHCVFPASQERDLFAFVDRFLLDQPADTDVTYTDGTFEFDEAQWIDWTVPKLQ
ncbi:hypothetical protein VTN00DRAFT_8742 [Thermoascus crustaceus]|uniref:uncharacterized protein n=1 Tax=Thermoascus crustaceus TaxID=5088 RepID=UPI003743CDEF